MGNKYKKRPCAYCGKVTGLNTGDHVLPDCLYTSNVDPKIQRAKVSACFECNNQFSKDETHFRTLLAAAGDEPGLEPSPERHELWEKAVASFHDPISGKGDLGAMIEQMKPVMIDGQMRHQIYPGQNEKVLRIVRKIIRGTAVFRGLLKHVPDSRVAAELLVGEIPEKYAKLLEMYYDVPKIATIFGREIRHKRLHSIWAMKILEVPFIGSIFME